ncbi:peptidase A8 [Lysinibacillus sphaericus]|uniref:signal peptidase II n=1 Tax=Lysinibacillus TaxID=400634 RepID=UPI0009A72433|nr:MULTISPECIES: signal peptidase II [unclassified Lysinibacillus]MBG9455092.1 peptidase A8 [Lysinibacillus sphaericus]MBG9478636.1 peptidase A8 [Lysinibacillus sphaericus]MBG9592363.1 peptidase A8 [Lysinibacillus sphaericus]OXS77335.1 signal peptidase II [Lysinibacillus sp. KCTC 33748]SKB33550.1 signal peptidase II [Lysinibacillus sp. AC-3]
MYKYYGLAAFVILLDQWTKWLIVKNMEFGERISVWDPWFGILSHRNRGAAWGMLEGQMWLFSIITIGVICAVLYFYHKEAKGKPIFQVGLMLLLGGAIGNFIDRIFRGEVVDFVSVLIPVINYDFPIFNIADAALTMAVVILMIGIIMEDKKGKKQVK